MVIFEHELRRSTAAQQTTRNINDVYCAVTTNVRVCDLSESVVSILTRQMSPVDTELWLDLLHRTTEELVAEFDVTIPTILTFSLNRLNKRI